MGEPSEADGAEGGVHRAVVGEDAPPRDRDDDAGEHLRQEEHGAERGQPWMRIRDIAPASSRPMRTGRAA